MNLNVRVSVKRHMKLMTTKFVKDTLVFARWETTLVGVDLSNINASTAGENSFSLHSNVYTERTDTQDTKTHHGNKETTQFTVVIIQ